LGGLRTGAGAGGDECTASGRGCTGTTGSSMLGVDDWSGETPAVGDVVARGIDGARRKRR